MPVVIVAYSGGYLPTAWSLKMGGLGRRVRGIILFDALYGEIDTFERFVADDPTAFLISTYTSSTRRGNAELERRLAARNLPIGTAIDGRLKPGSVVFVPAEAGTTHRDFLTRAFTDNPLKDLLARVRGYSKS